jgi:NADPH2:quinone reductase
MNQSYRPHGRTYGAIVLRAAGGPEQLRFEQVTVGEPGPGEIRLRQTAIGVNFHDIYVRSGSYRTLALPGIPGVEAVGIVDAVGAGVDDLRPGDRVAYVSGAYGAYAEMRLIAANRVLRAPEDIDDRLLAASLVKGLTACMLLMKVRSVRAGEWCLVHAAAGGVGRMLGQWARHLGARVIGTVGSEAKAVIARANGCEEVVLYNRESVPGRVREITGGRGVDAVYDSVGQDTFAGSLEALALRGHLVNFGQSSGPVEPIAMSRLAEKSLTVSRPILFHYIEDRGEREEMAGRLFEVLRSGAVVPEVGAEFPLMEAGEAHRVLEARGTSGSIVLTP